MRTFVVYTRKESYRANRLVGWCVCLNITLSNLEVSILCYETVCVGALVGYILPRSNKTNLNSGHY